MRSRSSKSRQSRIRGPSSRQKISSASRSPCPSTMRPSRIRASNSGARPARNRKASRSVSSMTAGSSGCRGASSSWICRVWPMLSAQRPCSVPAALFGHLRVAGRPGVLGGQNPRHPAQRHRHRRARADQCGQPPRRRHAAHHHQVIADPAVRAPDLGRRPLRLGHPASPRSPQFPLPVTRRQGLQAGPPRTYGPATPARVTRPGRPWHSYPEAIWSVQEL